MEIREMWYAVMNGPEDDDWGTGSFSIQEAKRMVLENRDIYPEGYIAAIRGEWDENGEPMSDTVCAYEIHDMDEISDYDE